MKKSFFFTLLFLIFTIHSIPTWAKKPVSQFDSNLSSAVATIDAAAKKLNIQSFVAFIDERKVMSFTPGKTKTRCFREGSAFCGQSQRISDGDFVGRIDIR